MLDPFTGTLYDYVGALSDIKHRIVGGWVGGWGVGGVGARDNIESQHTQ